MTLNPENVGAISISPLDADGKPTGEWTDLKSITSVNFDWNDSIDWDDVPDAPMPSFDMSFEAQIFTKMSPLVMFHLVGIKPSRKRDRKTVERYMKGQNQLTRKLVRHHQRAAIGILR